MQVGGRVPVVFLLRSHVLKPCCFGRAEYKNSEIERIRSLKKVLYKVHLCHVSIEKNPRDFFTAVQAAPSQFVNG